MDWTHRKHPKEGRREGGKERKKRTEHFESALNKRTPPSSTRLRHMCLRLICLGKHTKRARAHTLQNREREREREMTPPANRRHVIRDRSRGRAEEQKSDDKRGRRRRTRGGDGTSRRYYSFPPNRRSLLGGPQTPRRRRVHQRIVVLVRGKHDDGVQKSDVFPKKKYWGLLLPKRRRREMTTVSFRKPKIAPFEHPWDAVTFSELLCHESLIALLCLV